MRVVWACTFVAPLIDFASWKVALRFVPVAPNCGILFCAYRTLFHLVSVFKLNGRQHKLQQRTASGTKAIHANITPSSFCAAAAGARDVDSISWNINAIEKVQNTQENQEKPKANQEQFNFSMQLSIALDESEFRKGVRPQAALEEFYVIYANMTYLVPVAQVRELESLMDNKAAWDALPKREQQEKESELRQQSESAATVAIYIWVDVALWQKPSD